VVLANGRSKCGACDFGGPTKRVHLVGVSISFEKNFYQLPFTPSLSGRLIVPSGHKMNRLFNACDIERKILFP
jgi:hypothetical protein